MGKTILTMTHLDIEHNVMGDDRPTLVLAPLRVARDGWANEARKWEHLKGLDVVPVVGTPAQREAALRRDAQVFVTNYDNLVWLKEHLGERWPFRRVVADEASKLKGFRLRQGGVRARALAEFAHTKVREWISLTGTPASNGLEDLWGQTWFLDAGHRLGKSFSAFRSRWFRPVASGQFHRWHAAEHARDEIQERLRDICLTLDPKDWFDLRDPIVNIIEVELPPTARRHYRELERELFTMLTDGTELEVFNAAAKSMKCLQFANGAVYVDEHGDWREVHTEKLDALGELVDETGDDPLLVLYQFKSDKARLLRRFPDAVDLSTTEGMRAAMAGKGKLWLGHPASMGHGVDGLQEWCNTVVFFAQDWNLEYHDQALERVGPMRQLQAGKDRGVFLHYIVARGTIDHLVMDRRASKRNVQDILLDYLKGRS